MGGSHPHGPVQQLCTCGCLVLGRRKVSCLLLVPHRCFGLLGSAFMSIAWGVLAALIRPLTGARMHGALFAYACAWQVANFGVVAMDVPWLGADAGGIAAEIPQLQEDASRLALATCPALCVMRRGLWLLARPEYHWCCMETSLAVEVSERAEFNTNVSRYGLDNKLSLFCIYQPCKCALYVLGAFQAGHIQHAPCNY